MAKANKIGTSSIKKCLLLGISTRFSLSFLKQRRWKCLTETNSDIVLLYMWGEYFIDILAHKAGKNANIGHFGYVQFANDSNQCLTVES